MARNAASLPVLNAASAFLRPYSAPLLERILTKLASACLVSLRLKQLPPSSTLIF